MNSIRKVFFRLIHIATAALLGIALFFAIRIGLGFGIPDVGMPGLNQVKEQIAQNFSFTSGALWLLIAMLILLFAFLLIPGSWLDHASHRGRVIFFWVLTACLLGIQLHLVFGLNIIQNTDSFEVQDQALAIVRGVQKTVDYTKSAYFRKYGNNDLYLVVCMLLYRICDFLKIVNWQKFFVFFNLISIDLGIFMACRIIWLIKGPATGLKAYFLCVLNPLNYLLLHWTYTCTFSAPLMMLSIYAAVLVSRKKDGPIRRILAAIVIAVTAAFGYSMRPTATFPVIALAVCILIFGVSGKTLYGTTGKKSKKKSEWKASRAKKRIVNVTALVLAVICMAGTSLAVRKVSNQYDPDQRYKFPLEHWIMIGITGNGRVTGEDIHYTQSFPTVKEKQAADRKAIKDTLKKRGAAGTAGFYLEKIGLTWSDGTGEYYQRTTESENSDQILYQMTSGEDCGATILYCQAYRIVLLLMAILGILRNLHERQSGFFTVFTVTVLGGLVFYMFWEGKPVYSFPFLYYLVLLGCNAWNPMTRRYALYADHRSGWTGRLRAVTIGMILALTGISIWFRGYAISNKPYYTDPVIVCDDRTLVEWQTFHGAQSMAQEFYPKFAFNHIRIRARKNPAGTGEMLVQLRCGQKVIAEKQVTGKELKDELLYLTFSKVRPKKGQKYEILFQNLTDGQSPIELGTRLCYVSSQYRGERLVNGMERAGDTLMRVYYRKSYRE